MRAKFEVSSFNRSQDIEGSQNSKSGSRDSFATQFDLILHFLKMAPVVNMSVKFDANIFIGDCY